MFYFKYSILCNGKFSRMFPYSFILIQLLFVISSCDTEYQPIINTPTGKISGKTDYFDGIPVLTFLGIPYAKPPLGSLRFKKPVQVEPWDGILQAHHLAPGCIQCPKVDYPFVDDKPGLSENCLYLNIWAPAITNNVEKKSVMFFIHGGGFTVGSTRISTYNGLVMSALGDVVVVTTNYRVGSQGFLYSETEDIPGNMGLYDMLEALKWVNNNIESFGGNRESITLYGQSAGAIAITMFMTSPLFKGLFRRVILDSGSSLGIIREDNRLIYNFTESLMKEVGCLSPGESLRNYSQSATECLKGVNGMEICKIQSTLTDKLGYKPYYRTGDEIISAKPRILYRQEEFRPYDMLIGTNRNEGSDQVIQRYPEVFGNYGMLYPHLNLTLGKHIIVKYFKPFANILSPDAVADYYLNEVDPDDSTEIFNQVQKSIGDFIRICPSVYLSEVNAEREQNVYYYKFNHISSNSPYAEYLGVVHCAELPYVFGTPLLYPERYEQSEIELSRFMLHTWTGFAKYGVPPALPSWPLYNKNSHLLVELNAESTPIKVGRHLKNCNFFRPIFGF